MEVTLLNGPAKQRHRLLARGSFISRLKQQILMSRDRESDALLCGELVRLWAS
jgi:hypothetical protein